MSHKRFEDGHDVEHQRARALAALQASGSVKSITIQPTTASDSTHPWVELGPSTELDGWVDPDPKTDVVPNCSGRVLGIAPSADGTRVYATNHMCGVWGSTDGGSTWKLLVDTATAISNLPNNASKLGDIQPLWDYVSIALVEGGAADGSQDTVFVSAAQCFSTERGKLNYFEPSEDDKGGILVSQDGGSTWAWESTGNAVLGSLTVVPATTNPIQVVGVYGDVYTRGTSNWSVAVTTQKNMTQLFSVTDKRAAGSPTYWFGATSRGEIGRLSFSSGGTWTQLTLSGIPTSPRPSFVHYALQAEQAAGKTSVAAKTDRIYALVGARGQSNSVALYQCDIPRSATTATAASISISGMSKYSGRKQGPHTWPVVSPDSDQVVFFSITDWNAYRVAVSGKSATVVELQGIGADTRTFVVRGSNPPLLWIGCDFGLYRAADSAQGGYVFRSCNSGLGGFLLTYLAQHPTQDAVILCGSQDNGGVGYTGSGAWRLVSGGDSGSFLFNWANPDSALEFGSVGRRVDRSSQSLERFSYKTVLENIWNNKDSNNQADNAVWYAPLISPPYDASATTDTKAKLVILGATRPYVSEDFGDSWKQIGDNLPGQAMITAAAFAGAASATPSAFYVGTNTGKIYLYSKGSAWTSATSADISDSTAPEFGQNRVMDIVVDPANANNAVYLLFGGRGSFRRVWHGVDSAGWTWTQCSGTQTGQTIKNGLPTAHFGSLAVDPAHPTHLYAGGDAGVYRSTDGGTTWQLFSTGLPSALVRDLKFHPTQAGLLRAATWGRGVHETKTDAANFFAAVKLNIRSTILDRGLFGVHNGAADPTRPGHTVDYRESPDIKVLLPYGNDQSLVAPPVDFVKFANEIPEESSDRTDQTQGSVYVQVHNRGTTASPVTVLLLRATAATGINPAGLPATFDASSATAGGTYGVWTVLGKSQPSAAVKAAYPQVAAFSGIPVGKLVSTAKQQVWLLAVTTASGDAFSVGANTTLEQLCLQEPKAAVLRTDIETKGLALDWIPIYDAGVEVWKPQDWTITDGSYHSGEVRMSGGGDQAGFFALKGLVIPSTSAAGANPKTILGVQADRAKTLSEKDLGNFKTQTSLVQNVLSWAGVSGFTAGGSATSTTINGMNAVQVSGTASGKAVAVVFVQGPANDLLMGVVQGASLSDEAKEILANIRPHGITAPTIYTVAGTGANALAPSPTPTGIATSINTTQALSIAVDEANDCLYFSDQNNDCIWRVDFQTDIMTPIVTSKYNKQIGLIALGSDGTLYYMYNEASSTGGYTFAVYQCKTPAKNPTTSKVNLILPQSPSVVNLLFDASGNMYTAVTHAVSVPTQSTKTLIEHNPNSDGTFSRSNYWDLPRLNIAIPKNPMVQWAIDGETKTLYASQYNNQSGPQQVYQLDLLSSKLSKLGSFAFPQGVALSNDPDYLLVTNGGGGTQGSGLNTVELFGVKSSQSTIIAGDGNGSHSGDGGPATAASMNYPTCVATDSSGNIFVGTAGAVRKIVPAG